VYIYGSYRKNKIGVPFFGPPCMFNQQQTVVSDIVLKCGFSLNCLQSVLWNFGLCKCAQFIIRCSWWCVAMWLKSASHMLLAQNVHCSLKKCVMIAMG